MFRRIIGTISLYAPQRAKEGGCRQENPHEKRYCFLTDFFCPTQGFGFLHAPPPDPVVVVVQLLLPLPVERASEAPRPTRSGAWGEGNLTLVAVEFQVEGAIPAQKVCKAFDVVRNGRCCRRRRVLGCGIGTRYARKMNRIVAGLAGVAARRNERESKCESRVLQKKAAERCSVWDEVEVGCYHLAHD